MGTTTPAIGIYIPSAGETNYDQSFSSGMVNIDQHDHSGGPNKGVPIATEGLGDFSVTFDKLNANVVDPTTGIGVSGTLPNQLVLLDPIKNIFQLVSPLGFLVLNGTSAAVRTFTNTSTVSWTNGNGTGNPSANVLIAGLSPIGVANGGTGKTTLSPNDIICGGTTPTGAVQQVSGEGTTNQYLASQGANQLPIWKTLPSAPTQNVLVATVSVTAAQFVDMLANPIELVPAPGSGKVIVLYQLWGKLIYGGSDEFHGGAAVRTFYGFSFNEVNFVFKSGTFKDNYNSYYYADNLNTSTSTGIPIANMENKNVQISVNSTNFTGGTGNTVSFFCTYSIMQI